MKMIRNIQKNIFSYDSIDAAKNMAELVFHGNMCDMPTIDYSFNKEKKRRVLHYQM